MIQKENLRHGATMHIPVQVLSWRLTIGAVAYSWSFTWRCIKFVRCAVHPVRYMCVATPPPHLPPAGWCGVISSPAACEWNGAAQLYVHGGTRSFSLACLASLVASPPPYVSSVRFLNLMWRPLAGRCLACSLRTVRPSQMVLYWMYLRAC